MQNTTEVTTRGYSVTTSQVYGIEKTRPVPQIVIETVTLCVMWAAAILGNTMVCVVIQRSRRIQSTTNYFVMSLAVTDILICTVCVPLVFWRVVANRWPFGSFVCKTLRFTQFVFPSVILYLLLSICVDRFYTIIYPLSFKVTRVTAKRMIVCSSMLPAILTPFMYYFFDQYKTETNGVEIFYCPTFIPANDWLPVVYMTFIIVLTYIVPCAGIFVIYLQVFLYIWKFNLSSKTFQRTMNPVPRAKVKIIRMLMIVTLNTMAMYCPFYLLQTWSIVWPESYIEPTFFVACAWLLFSTCLLKPSVYLCQNTNFRRGCQEVLCRKALKCYRGNTYAVTSSWRKDNRVGIVDELTTTPDSRRLRVSTINLKRTPLTEKIASSSNGFMNTTYL